MSDERGIVSPRTIGLVLDNMRSGSTRDSPCVTVDLLSRGLLSDLGLSGVVFDGPRRSATGYQLSAFAYGPTQLMSTALSTGYGVGRPTPSGFHLPVSVLHVLNFSSWPAIL